MLIERNPFFGPLASQPLPDGPRTGGTARVICPPPYSDEELRALAKTHNEVLSLGLSECVNLTDFGLESLRDLAALQQLSLANCDGFTPSGFEYVSSVTTLQWLDLTNCRCFLDFEYGSLRCIDRLVDLRCLILDGLYDLSDCALADCCKIGSLEALSIWDSRLITDHGITMISLLPKLRVLDLPSFSDISDEGLLQLSNNARQLNELRLDHLSDITDEGVEALSRLPALEVVRISGCDRVTTAGIGRLLHAAALRVVELFEMRVNVDELRDRAHVCGIELRIHQNADT